MRQFGFDFQFLDRFLKSGFHNPFIVHSKFIFCSVNEDFLLELCQDVYCYVFSLCFALSCSDSLHEIFLLLWASLILRAFYAVFLSSSCPAKQSKMNRIGIKNRIKIEMG